MTPACSTSILVLALSSLLTSSSWALEDRISKKYPVGRSAFDTALFGGAELQIELWYPAAVTGEAEPLKGRPDFLFSPALKDALVEYAGMPRMAISTKEKGVGRRGVTPAKGPWPLVVFSHGFASFSRQNNRQAEALAQSGFVVAAVSHPGESLTTEYADGRVVPIDDAHPALQYMGKRADKAQLQSKAREMNTHLEPLTVENSAPEYLAAMQALRDNTLFGLYQTSAENRKQQLVEWIHALVATTPEDQRSAVLREIDQQRIALYGHSLGGIVSVAAAEVLREQGVAIGAAVNLDAPQFLLPKPNSVSLTGPTCFLMGGSTKAGKINMIGTRLNSIWATNNSQVCEINVSAAAHNNFTDLSWVTVLKWFGQLGSVSNKKFGEWLNGFLVAYFEHHLKGSSYDYPMWSEAELEGQVTAQ